MNKEAREHLAAHRKYVILEYAKAIGNNLETCRDFGVPHFPSQTTLHRTGWWWVGSSIGDAQRAHVLPSVIEDKFSVAQSGASHYQARRSRYG